MSYTSWSYYIMLLLLIPAYYLLPKKHRWFVLLAGSMFFFVQLMQRKLQLIVFFGIAATSWAAGLFNEKLRKTPGTILRKAVLWAGILLTLLPLVAAKGLLTAGQSRFAWLFVMGQSFFTLQIIAYLTDIYRGKIGAQKNILKYLLFVSFFPQLIQGPIPRYEQLSSQLFEGNDYRFENLVGGAQLILWGFFLKYMIADKAAIAATPVFDQYRAYSGGYVWAGGLLYIIQLYADFLSCTTLAQGAAQLFGIRLTDNFQRPLFSESIKELWQKWHMSLGTWLRDYVYIPLGGNRRGRLRKWMNVVLTYAVSGLWHGMQPKYLIWGLLVALLQISQDFSEYLRKQRDARRGYPRLRAPRALRILWNTFLFTLSLIVFRAVSIGAAAHMLRSMFTDPSPWIWLDGSLLRLGLNGGEYVILALSVGVLFLVSLAQEHGVRIREWIGQQPLWLRWVIPLLAVWAIWIFGTYSSGFNTTDFIYGGF